MKSISYVSTSGWRGEVQLSRRASDLIDGQKDGFKLPWFTSGYGNFSTSAPAATALTGWPAHPRPRPLICNSRNRRLVNSVTVYEDPAHPEAIPQEIKIEAWVNDNWQTVVHDLWVSAATHVHHFPPVTTNKLRYTVMGDLYHNLWTTEIEVERAP